RLEVARAGGLGLGERARADAGAGVAAGEGEAEAGVLDLVGEGLLGGEDELGRGADGEQLEDVARERGDAGVLGEGDLRPVGGGEGAQVGRGGGDGGEGAPVVARGGGGGDGALVDEEGPAAGDGGALPLVVDEGAGDLVAQEVGVT